MRKGTELFFQQPRKRAVAQPRERRVLASPEDRLRSIEQDIALTALAKREQQENVAEEGRIKNARARFELFRHQLNYWIKLALTVISLIGLAVFALLNPAVVPLILSGTSTAAGILSLLFGGNAEKP